MIEIDLKGKIALVTGGTGELGRAITRTLADCGAAVAIHYRNNLSQAEALRNEISNRGGCVCLAQGDITDFESVSAMRTQIESELGSPDILVSTAVAQYKWVSILEQGLEDYESQFRSCVMQAVILAKVFVPAMIERKYGRVVVLNTECAMQSLPRQSAYVAGKRGMDGVLRVLAREIGEHGITVNQVAPGWMISDRDRKAGTERQPSYDKNVPLGHRGDDQDVANTVAFLASDLARFISGVYLPVCGGNVMPAI